MTRKEIEKKKAALKSRIASNPHNSSLLSELAQLDLAVPTFDWSSSYDSSSDSGSSDSGGGDCGCGGGGCD